MFTNNPNIISNGPVIFYHGIELSLSMYNKGVLDILNVSNELTDTLIKKINNKNIFIVISIKYGDLTSDPIHLHFRTMHAYKNDNVFTVEFVIFNKYIKNCELCANDYKIIGCRFDDSSTSKSEYIKNTL